MKKNGKKNITMLFTILLITVFILSSCVEETSTTKNKNMVDSSESITEEQKLTMKISDDNTGIWFYTANNEKMFIDYDSFEHQGEYARIMVGDNWGIVDRDANVVIPFVYDYINELPYIFTYASGVKDGHVVIINLSRISEYETRELKQYVDVEEIMYGCIAYVKDKGNKVGLVSAKGEELIAPQYKSMSAIQINESVFEIEAVKIDGGVVTYHVNPFDKKVLEIE